MFDVCPGCGEYSENKEVLHGPTRVRCACGHQHPFSLLSAFFVTGASGTGKTTVALKLQQFEQDFVILDQDILWNDGFNNGDADHRLFRNTWLRMIKNINQVGKPVVLFGSTIPDQIENCPQRKFIGDIHYLALVCESAELTARLKARPSWRQSGTEDTVSRMLEFNTFLQNASGMSKEDTTHSNIEATVDAVRRWYKSHH